MLCRRFVANSKGRRDNSRENKRSNHQPTKSEGLKRQTKGKLKCRKTWKKWGHLRSRRTRTLLILLKSTNEMLEGTNWKTVEENKNKAGHFEPSRPKFIRRTLPWALWSAQVRTLRDAVEVTSSFWYVTQNKMKSNGQIFLLFSTELEEKFCTSCKTLRLLYKAPASSFFQEPLQRRSGRSMNA